MALGFALFDTNIGRCGIAWNETDIIAIRLPARDNDTTAASLRKCTSSAHPKRPPPFVAEAVSAITAHLAGRRNGNTGELDALPLDLSRVSAFDRAVLMACRKIPAGATRTYGEIAKELGDPLAARAVGAALGRNPWPIVVPCHRVVAAHGKLGGFSAPGGRISKIRLLDIEGATRTSDPSLFDVAR